MTAAQVREAARLLDLVHAPDEEIVNLVELGADAQLRIGPLRLTDERLLPLSLVPRRYLIDRAGSSSAEESIR